LAKSSFFDAWLPSSVIAMLASTGVRATLRPGRQFTQALSRDPVAS
jgi:hypothetical protein